MGPMTTKTKVKRVTESTSTSSEPFDSIRFHTLANSQKFVSFVKFRSDWCERKVFLDELDPFVKQNIESRSWLPICPGLEPPPTAIIREFYFNLSVHSTVSGGHFLTTWIRGEDFQITKKVVADALSVPLVPCPTYPYIESLTLDDVMSFLCGKPMTWGIEPRLNCHE